MKVDGSKLFAISPVYKRVNNHPKGQNRTSVSNRLESACQRPKVYNKAANIPKVTKDLPVSKSLEKARQYPKALREHASIQKLRKGQAVLEGYKEPVIIQRFKRGPPVFKTLQRASLVCPWTRFVKLVVTVGNRLLQSVGISLCILTYA